MAFEGFAKEGVSWFDALALAQNREWFQANKAAYESLWVTPMKALLEELHAPISKIYGFKVGPPKVFRINRDVRFAKDKRPYKTNIAGMIAVNGSNPKEGPAALYLHLGAEEFVGFGFYWLEPPSLLKLRKKLLDEKEGPKLGALVEAARKKGFSSDARETLKRPPPGVAKDHPRVELLKHKALAVGREDIPKSVRYSAKLKNWLLEQAEVAAPVVKWGIKEKL
jgi:uncharacterized protein (TIGR02453 family)